MFLRGRCLPFSTGCFCPSQSISCSYGIYEAPRSRESSFRALPLLLVLVVRIFFPFNTPSVRVLCATRSGSIAGFFFFFRASLWMGAFFLFFFQLRTHLFFCVSCFFAALYCLTLLPPRSPPPPQYQTLIFQFPSLSTFFVWCRVGGVPYTRLSTASPFYPRLAELVFFLSLTALLCLLNCFSSDV